jgi:hypothetical protein
MTDTASAQGEELSSDVLGVWTHPMKATAFTGVIEDTLEKSEFGRGKRFRVVGRSVHGNRMVFAT